MGSQKAFAVLDRTDDASERLRILSELTSDFIYVATFVDGELINRWISESFDRVFGAGYDELRARHWTELIHPEDHQMARRRMEVLFSGREFVCEIRIFGLDGQLHWLRDQARPVVHDGRVVSICGAAQDITEQKLYEARLRESENRYRNLIERSPVPIIVHSDEIIAFANERALEAFRADQPEDVIGQSIWVGVPEDERSRLARRVEQIYAKDLDSTPFEAKFQRLDGTTFDVEVMSTMIDLGGRPAAEVVFQDISDRKRAERLAREQEEREQRAQKLESLGSLAAGIAHDFNNILVGVMGHADLALEYLSSDSPAGGHVEELGKGAQHAADLAQLLLDYAGEKRSQIARLDLSELVREMDRLLRVSVQKRAELDVDLGDALPSVEGDPTQLRQVAMNLILNAADAIAKRQRAASNGRPASPGTISVRTYLHRCANGSSGFHESFLPEHRGNGDPAGMPQSPRSPTTLVVLDVADDGCGMDEATRRRVFEPFYTTKSTGRGLGMATVLGILRAHKGAVGIESQPGEGTRIRVAFPAAS